MIVAIIILGTIAAGLLFLFIKRTQDVKTYREDLYTVTEKHNVLIKASREELNAFIEKYKDIIEVDKTLATKNEEVKNLTQDFENLKANFGIQKEQLNQDYISKRAIYENLLNEISILEESLEDISYGLYKPHYDYSNSEEYKQKLDEIWNKEKEMIKSDKAVYCPTEWTVSGSKVEGRKMVKHQSKLMLRAFNGECESAISKVSWNNIGTMETRISKAFDAINNLGSTQLISITKEYSDLKLQELRLEFELQEKIHEEKEEQKKIREQMREEQKVQQEMEKVRREAEEEESRYQKALEKAKGEISNAAGTELELLNNKIKTLEENLKKAQEQKARAISRAQQTKSGHVYIISNIGSFGENVYKFGMTRRLDPQERIDELGNASVPFDFDVHGIIYSENAPELENKLHKRINDRRINLVQIRREFFHVTMDEIEEIVKELNLELQLTKIAEAKAFRMSQSIREAKEKQSSLETETAATRELDKFPTTLN
jgi:hypothetical protein